MEATPPRVDPKYALPLRLVALALAYAVYRVTEPERLSAGVFCSLGTLLIGYALVTFLTSRRDERSGMFQTGQVILGAGLVGLGLLQLVT